jgi:hypothetical protein
MSCWIGLWRCIAGGRQSNHNNERKRWAARKLEPPPPAIQIGIWTIGNLLAVWLDYFPWLGSAMEILRDKLAPVLALVATVTIVLFASI